jgi:bacterioferritin-associated ferredoxin
MLVCHCAGLTERAIHRCIEDGAHSEYELGTQCGAGIDCGGCLPMLRELLAEVERKSPMPFPAPHTAA